MYLSNQFQWHMPSQKDMKRVYQSKSPLFLFKVKTYFRETFSKLLMKQIYKTFRHTPDLFVVMTFYLRS